MTGTSFSSPSSYWQVSRAPRYSLLFALPLLVFYQVLAVLLAHGARSVLNGADVIFQSLFTAWAGAASFSRVHYIGPSGSRWQRYSFAFLMVAGLFFPGLYLARGFGITAWTHALYDVLLLFLQ